jgi:hypothetical protein
VSRQPHGTRARYRLGCQCLPCRAANARYENQRWRARRGAPRVVSATPARAHIAALSREGVGFKSVADACSLSPTTTWLIRVGRRERILAETERRILSVDGGARAGGALVRAGSTWSRVRILLAEGFTKAELARRLGYQRPALKIGRGRITARIAVRIERFYNLMTRNTAVTQA